MGDEGGEKSKPASRVFSRIDNAQKLVGLVLGLIALIGAAVTGIKWLAGHHSAGEFHPDIAGWGPERATYSIKTPAPLPALNSIVDNPVYGDTRNFVQVRLRDFTNSTYSETLTAAPGDELAMNVTVTNDCADNVCAGGDAEMQGLEMSLENPSHGTELPFRVHLRAKNAPEVWDGATVRTSVPSRLQLVDNSCEMHSADANFPLSSKPLTQGGWMKLGEFKQDGQYPVGLAPNGMERGAGFVTCRLKVISD